MLASPDRGRIGIFVVHAKVDLGKWTVSRAASIAAVSVLVISIIAVSALLAAMPSIASHKRSVFSRFFWAA